MKKTLYILSLGLLITFLAGCQNIPESNENNNQANGPSSENVSEVQDISSEYYRPVVREGKYQVNQSRGVTLRLNSTANLESFETGLMNVAKDYFPTESHYFEEGQYISSDVIQSWLERKSRDNENGLNPEDNGEVEPDTRNPIYLETILEQDYYHETEDGLRLNGIVIGLGMNSVDYYTKEAYGPTYETPISREQVLTQGKQMAEEMLPRLREIEELQDVTIVFGIFEQAASDNLAGGVYVSEAVSEDGTGLSEFSTINHQKTVLPFKGEETTISNSFDTFKTEIENFFPNLSGVIGISEYVDDQPIELQITVTTQFFGEAEMIAFTQYVDTVASEYLPANLDIEIVIDSMDGTEAILQHAAESENFESYILSK